MRKRILKGMFKKRRLDLETKTNLKDYFLLTTVIGIGLFVCIVAFTVLAKLQYDRAHQDFEVRVNQAHEAIESSIHNHALHFEILVKMLFESRSMAGADNYAWLRPRIEKTNFECIEIVEVNIQSAKILDTQILKGKERCVSVKTKSALAEFDRREWSEKLIEKVDDTGSSSATRTSTLNFVSLVSKVSANKERYLVAFLSPQIPALNPDEVIDLQLNIHTYSAEDFINTNSLNETPIVLAAREAENTGGPYTRFRWTNLGSRYIGLEYSPKSGALNVDMTWPWIILLLGLVIVTMLASMVYNLVNRNVEIHSVVKSKTRELQVATEAAILANKTKSRFLANVSHEVRTPLNLILGMAELLRETKLEAEQSKYVNTFSAAGKHLLDLIDDLLDVARIESGEFEVRKEELDLISLIEGVADMVNSACQKKKLEFSYYIEPTVPKLITGDAKRIRQILINLLNNAIKFTTRGGVVLHVETGKKLPKDGGVEIVFEVRDSGIGISESQLEMIFNEFHRTKEAKQSDNSGVGLGLSIVRTFVNHLGGSVKVESYKGIGSTFTVSMPSYVTNSSPWIEDYRQAEETLKDKRIFVLTAQMTDCRYFQDSFESMGCEVKCVNSDEVALQILKQRGADFDIIIADISNESFAGINFIRRLQFDSKRFKDLHIYYPSDMAPELVGVKNIILDNCYSKPLKMGTLLNSIAGIKPSRVSFEGGKISGGEDQLGKLSLLIAEDDLENQNLIQAFLANQNVDVYFASNGYLALDYYKKMHLRLDLVITDIQMPVMDGFGLVNNIRLFEKSQSLGKCPIVVLTADAQEEQVTRLKEMGADEYLTKPINKKSLLGAIACFHRQTQSENV